MIETIEQARESVANLNPAIDFGILMTVAPANYAQALWQAAYRESRQGEAFEPCLHLDNQGRPFEPQPWAHASLDEDDAPEYDPESDIDGDYLQSLEDASIDGPGFYSPQF